MAIEQQKIKLEFTSQGCIMVRKSGVRQRYFKFSGCFVFYPLFSGNAPVIHSFLDGWF